MEICFNHNSGLAAGRSRSYFIVLVAIVLHPTRKQKSTDSWSGKGLHTRGRWQATTPQAKMGLSHSLNIHNYDNINLFQYYIDNIILISPIIDGTVRPLKAIFQSP